MNRITDAEKRELGRKIKTARKQKGISQEQLADLVGYKVGTISKYEQGDRTPDIAMLKKIAEALDCNLAELAGTTEEVIVETIRFDDAIEDYLKWLRGVNIMLTTPYYEDDNQNGNPDEKRAIIVDIDGKAFDIGDCIDDIMVMSKEHFKLLSKQLGKNVFEV